MRLTSICNLCIRTLAGCASLGLLTLVTSSPSVAQDQNQQQERSSPPTTQRDTNSQADADEAFADDEAPELGVLVGSCPGDGVCVLGTMWDSPASHAGIMHGDYILAVDGKEITSPRDLCKAVQNQKAGSTVKVTAWRQGRKFTEDVTLASEANETPRGHGAWIGVGLAHPGAEDGQISIAAVQPRSPAEQAGLEQGDVILQTNGQDVETFEKFIDRVQDAGPGEEIRLTISRDGTQHTKTVKVGAINDAPLRWRRQALQGMPSTDNMGSDRSGMMDESMSEMLDQMRQQIRDLERKVEQMSKDGETVSGLNFDDRGYILAQNRHRQYRRRGYGNNWYNRNYYRGNRNHYYRSPRYGNSYYRYGGRSYYNRNPYRYGHRYGNRNGFRFNRNGIRFYW